MIKKALITTVVVSCSACSFLDPAASGNVVGTQVDEISVPEDGKLIISHVYERKPSKKGKNEDNVYNRRTFFDWFLGRPTVKKTNSDYVK